MPTVLSKARYKKLLADLQRIIGAGKEEAERAADPSYLYKAEVRDVIDADTILLDIDLGFEVIRRQPIRLARIDAPPRDTPEGAAGRRYVREQLAA